MITKHLVMNAKEILELKNFEDLQFRAFDIRHMKAQPESREMVHITTQLELEDDYLFETKYPRILSVELFDNAGYKYKTMYSVTRNE